MITNCKSCGKTLKIRPSRINKNGNFCNSKCLGVWFSKSRTGKGNPLWKKKVKVNCKVCNKEREILPSRLAIGKGLFCSKRCKVIFENCHRKTNGTCIELAIEQELIKRKIQHEKQVVISIAKTVVDFLLPNKIVIYCDGVYWHKSERAKKKGVPSRDCRQDFLLGMNGYKVFRFTDIEIMKSARRCVNKVI